MSSPTSQPSFFDQKDLEKYSKHFFYKVVNIVIQSRLGEKIKTNCQPTPTSGAGWFNIALKDHGEVTLEAKKALSTARNSGFLDSPLCTEVSLKTAEGDTMVLETWVLSKSDATEVNIQNNTIYNNMGLLLKSLLCATRVTPAYKLSRRQSAETYIICYRVFCGESICSLLGDGYQTCTIGQVSTPLGTLNLRVEYRTKMTISSSHSNTVLVKSDHFDSELKTIRSEEGEFGVTTSDESQEAMRIFATSPPSPSSNFHGYMKGHVTGTGTGSGRGSQESLSSKAYKVGAFASVSSTMPHHQKEESTNDALFDLLPKDEDNSDDNRDSTAAQEQEKEQTVLPDKSHVKQSPLKASEAQQKLPVRSNEDFELLDLKTPFSYPLSDTKGDLGIFFRECTTTVNANNNALSQTVTAAASENRSSRLQGGDEEAAADDDERHIVLESQLTELTSQLSTFEENLVEYDDMIKQLELQTSESESEQN